jgi:hypothetical protein
MELAFFLEAFLLSFRNCAGSATSTVSSGFIATVKKLCLEWSLVFFFFFFPVRYTMELFNELMFLALYIKAH